MIDIGIFSNLDHFQRQGWHTAVPGSPVADLRAGLAQLLLGHRDSRTPAQAPMTYSPLLNGGHVSLLSPGTRPLPPDRPRWLRVCDCLQGLHVRSPESGSLMLLLRRQIPQTISTAAPPESFKVSETRLSNQLPHRPARPQDRDR